jgi:hypothetical protein
MIHVMLDLRRHGAGGQEAREHMAVDIASLAPRAREHYLALGPRYPATAVLAQANATMLGLRQHGPALVTHGFGPSDARRLEEIRDALLAHLTTRTQARAGRQASRKTHASARRSAREERRCARAVLELAVADLLEADDDAWLVPHTALLQTRRLSSNAVLPVQMDTLYEALIHPAVAPMIVDRGGTEIAQRLTDAREELLACNYENAAHPEVTATAEHRTLLCGMAITLVRSANAAARVAARRLGKPAIAAAFKLVHLEPPRRKRTAAAAPPEEPPPPSSEPASAAAATANTAPEPASAAAEPASAALTPATASTPADEDS